MKLIKKVAHNNIILFQKHGQVIKDKASFTEWTDFNPFLQLYTGLQRKLPKLKAPNRCLDNTAVLFI